MDDLAKREKISDTSYIYLVDDGSKDNTWYEIALAVARHPNKIKATKFSANFGNQKALLAGMLGAKKVGCDAVVTIDADLQQDEGKIEEFVQKYDEGYEIVLGIRNDRNTDGFFKKITALAFYKIMKLNGVKIPKNHSDYRLVSSAILDVLEKFKETDLFLRSFIHEIGFKKAVVYFDVKKRMVGSSKFNFFSLFALAMNGITSFSVKPLRFIGILGFICVVLAFLAGLYVLAVKFVWHDSTDTWAQQIIITSFFGGMQVFCTGIIAEYLGQIFREVKARPRYIIEEELM